MIEKPDTAPVDAIVVSPLLIREQRAMAWLFSSEAGELPAGEARRKVRERFGADVEESLQQKFTGSA